MFDSCGALLSPLRGSKQLRIVVIPRSHDRGYILSPLRG